MAVDQADLDALKTLNAQIAAAEKQVAMGGQQITYRSINELLTARRDIEARIEAAQVADGTKERRPKQRYAYQSGKGY